MLADNQSYQLLQDALAIVGIVAGVSAATGFAIARLKKWIIAQVQPNGKKSLALGDTTARTEDKVDELRGLLLHHVQYHPPASGLPASLVPVPSPMPSPTRSQLESTPKPAETPTTPDQPAPEYPPS